jgi:hypothetical protein
MKRLTTVLVIALLAGLVALPRPAGAGIRLGVKAGGNMARPTGLDGQDPVATLKTKTGFTGGVFVSLDFSRNVSVQWEALYTMKGAVYVAADDTFADKLYADYLEVPLLLKVRIPLAVIQPFVFAGPTVGFKLHEKLESNGEEVPLPQSLLKGSDYGAVFGAGLNLGPNFMADVRYSLGMQKVVSTFHGEVPSDLKNGVWSASVGIFF